MKKVLALLTIVIALLSFCSCDLINPNSNGGNTNHNQNENENQNPDNGISEKEKAAYSVDFYVENKLATSELKYIFTGVMLKDFVGEIVDIKDHVEANIPKDLYIDKDASTLSGAIVADGSLKLSVYLKLNHEKLQYDFTQDNPFVKYAVSPAGSAEITGISPDTYASNGYSLSVNKGSTAGGINIATGSREVSDYERIIIRVKADGSDTYKIVVNGDNALCDIVSGAYRVYDLKPLLSEAGVNEISSIGVNSTGAELGSVSIDAIAFIGGADLQSTDPSFLVRRDDNSAYISDFNIASVMQLVEKIGINHLGNAIAEECEVTHDIAESVKGYYNYIYNGIKLVIGSDKGTVSAFKYHLPTHFDLSESKEIVIRFTTAEWHGGGLASFIHFTNRDQTENIINYCKIYFDNGQNATGSYTTTNLGTLKGQNYLRCTLVLDVAAFTRATGMTSIDGIIFGSDRTTKYNTHVLDEIYYTFNGNERVIPTTEFTSATITNRQGYYIEDTAHGVSITGKSWSYAECVLNEAISGADINTLTVRYKESDTEQALIKFISGTKEIFVNLTKAQAGDTGIISKIVDEYGFTVITIDFKLIPSSEWAISERTTMNLTEISIGSSHSLGSPVFDYVAYNI